MILGWRRHRNNKRRFVIQSLNFKRSRSFRQKEMKRRWNEKTTLKWWICLLHIELTIYLVISSKFPFVVMRPSYNFRCICKMTSEHLNMNLCNCGFWQISFNSRQNHDFSWVKLTWIRFHLHCMEICTIEHQSHVWCSHLKYQFLS